MKDVKTRPSEKTPRILSDIARAPKELVRKSIIATKEKTQEVTERQQPESESPEQYAENRIERTAEETVQRTGQEVSQQGKQLVHRTKEVIRKNKDRISETKNTHASADTPNNSAHTHNSSSAHGNTYRAGRERVVRNAQNTRNANRTIRQTSEKVRHTAATTNNTVKATAKGTVKTAQKSVKSVQTTVKTAKKGVKTAQQTAKLARKAAQATAKAAQAAAKAAQAAAKAAVAAAKAAAKAIAIIIKWIVAAIKALIAAIAAGGWIVVVIILIVAVIALVLCLCFGVFSSNESGDGKPMTEAIVSIDDEFNASITDRIAEFTASGNADITEIIYEGDMEEGGTVWNWADVIGVYSVKTTTNEEEQTEVITVTPEKIEKLKTVFYDMNKVSYRTETETVEEIQKDEHGAIVLDEDGEPVVMTTKTLYIYVNVSSMDYRDGADLYSFDKSQMEMLNEMMRPEYYPMFAELIGDEIGDGGEYGLGLDINPDLPPNELGAMIVQAAKKYIGRSYSSMDCSGLVRTALKDCGLNSMNGLTSTGMAEKCRDTNILFTDASQLQAGDLIFFARKDASRGEGYCTDHNRCGNGKCQRWMQIHHVAIYINDTYLIDSTGGKNSVQIRKHWGVKNSEWEWICFGRVTN